MAGRKQKPCEWCEEEQSKKRKALEKKLAAAESSAKAASERATGAGTGETGEVAALRAEAEKTQAEVDRLRRELAMSGEITVTFRVYFAAWQKDYMNMMETLAKADEDTASRLKAAIEAQIKGWING